MWKKVCGWVLYKLMGWTCNVTQELPKKFVICLAPHTSNYDFLMGLLFSRAYGFKSNFLMKKEWFFWPLGPIFKRLGGIPVYRSKHTSMTDSLAETAKRLDEFHLCITPEGTRSRNPEWKRGFYFIAQKANIPILIFALDYERKLIECVHTIIPDGDVDRQMREIKTYYKEFKGKHPENFTVGEL